MLRSAERTLALPTASRPGSYEKPTSVFRAPAISAGLERAGQFCAGMTLCLGALGLAGWLFNHPQWRSIWKSGSEMKFNTALALTLLGASLFLAAMLKGRARYASQAGAMLVLCIAGLTLLEYVFGVNLGFDELVFHDTNQLGTTHPGRMAWHSALTFTFLALGALLIENRRNAYITQWLAVGAAFFPVQALIGYVYSTMSLLGMSAQTGYMAVPTSVAFICAAIALLLRVPDRGMMATLTAPTHTSSAFRHLLAIFVFVPLVLGWVTLHVAGGAHRTPEYNVATVATLTTVLLASLAWLYAFRLNSAEAALRRNEANLRDFMENASIGIHWVGPDGTILWANKSELALLGYTADEYIGRNIAEFHTDRSAIDSILACLARGETLDGREARLRCKDGSVRDVLINSNVLFENGEFIHTRCFTRDITERKSAEEAKAKLAAIVQFSDDAIVSKDLNGIITSWNRGAENLFGYTAPEAIGQSITMLIPEDRLEEEPGILESIRKGLTIDQFETIRRRKDGTLLDIALTVSPIRNDQGEIIGVSKIARNITDRKRTEAALAKAQAELRQHADSLERTVAQRTARLRETVGELESYSYSISHDMRAPLRAMQAYAQVLLTDYSTLLDAAGKRYLERIMASSNRLDKLIQDVLSYSRISRAEVRLEPINLNRLIEDIIDEYPAVRAAEIELRQPLGSVVGAEALLTQAISNLLTNAAKFVALGQTPRIRIWTETSSSAASAPAMVNLFIQDHGIGIAPEDQQRIFGIFARVHSEKEYEGTGIGLSIVKKAVERMGGEIDLTSEIGKGSTFCLQLPKA